jgi:hypothetical protein
MSRRLSKNNKETINMHFRQSTLIEGKEVFPTVRHIQFRGSNFELGRQLAELNIANHGDFLEKHRAADPVYARVQKEYLKRHWPAQWERARGAASAYGADPEDDGYDFSTLWYNMDLPLRPGCSNAFYPPHRSADGHTYLSRNFEFSTGTLADVAGVPLPPEINAQFAAMMGEPYIMEWQPTDGGYASWAMHSNDLLGGAFDGINSADLAVALMADETAMGTLHEPHMGHAGKVGINELQIVRLLLDSCATTAEAKHLLLNVKHFYAFVPCHYIIADASGDSFVFQFSHGRNHERILEGGGEAQVCSNHATIQSPNGEIPPLTLATNSEWRYAMLQTRVKRQERFTPTEIRANSAAVSISRLTELLLADPSFRTIAANVDSRTLWYTLYDLTAGQVEVDFYLSSALTESGEYVERRSKVFSFAAPENVGAVARIGLEAA